MMEKNIIISRILSEYMIDLDYLYQKKDTLPVDQAMILKEYYLNFCPCNGKNELEILCDLALMSKLNCQRSDTGIAWTADFNDTMKFQDTIEARDRFRKNLEAMKSKYEYTFLLN